MSYMSYIIGIAGPKGAGKTTVAGRLRKMMKPAAVCSFASPMKRVLKDLFNFSNEQLTTMKGKEEVDPRYGVSPRIIMQRFGTEFIRTTVPNLWVTLMKENIIKLPGITIIVDDVRFDNEAKLLRDMGGSIFHLYGRGEWQGDHPSEEGVVRYPQDIMVSNALDDSGKRAADVIFKSLRA